MIYKKSTSRSTGGTILVSPDQSTQILHFLQIQFPSDLSIHKKTQWLILLELIRDQGPVLDWTDDNGLLERFRKWKKKVEILFQGPLATANDVVKCNYIIYWSGETGMELVDKWETKDKINDAQIAMTLQDTSHCLRSTSLQKSNALITIVEFKRLFQETLSLEDFHTKALQASERSWIPRGSNMEQSTPRHNNQWSSLW